MGGITGWDRGLGTLLGLWLRDQAQRKQEETLRQLLEDQQRRATTADIGLGLQQGPVEPPGARTPAAPQQRSFLEALTQVPSDILQGATGGPPGLPVAREQYLQGEEDLKRQQTLADRIRLYQQTQALKPPGLDEQMLGVIAQTQGPQAALNTWQQHYANPLGLGAIGAQALQNIPGGPEAYARKLMEPAPGPQPTTIEQLKASMTPTQWQEYLNKQAGLQEKPSRLTPVDTGTGTMLMDLSQVPPGTVIPKQTKETAQERAYVAEGQARIKQIQSIEAMPFQDYVGRVTGGIGGVMRERYGRDVLGNPLTTEEANFRAKANTLYGDVLKFYTGANLSPAEVEWRKSMIPTPADPPEMFKQKLAVTKENVQRILDERKGLLNVGGQDLPKAGGVIGHPGAPSAAAPTVGAPGGAAPAGQGTRYRITSGPLKGTVVDNLDTLKQLRASGALKGDEQIEEGR